MSRGIYRKYTVKRTDGSSKPGGKHADCTYFVLDLEHDPFAIPALKAYMDACAETHPELANDIATIIDAERPACGCREAFCPHAPTFGPGNSSEMAGYLMKQARRLVVSRTIDACVGLDVPAMREIGGFSAEIRRQIDALGNEYRVDHGSKLWPFTVVDELQFEVESMRQDVQFTLAQVSK